MTITLQTGDGRSVLRLERIISHDRERVWRAVTDPAELKHWFPSEVIYEPRVGAPMTFDFGGEHTLDTWPGEVLAWDPPDVFAFAWAKDQLRFELFDAEDGATRLVFTHDFAHEPGKPARDAAGWEACFDAFDALLAGASDPQQGDWAAYEETYYRKFGELTLDGTRELRLQGPFLEHDGRVAVQVKLEGQPGVLLVQSAGEPLQDGVAVEVRRGTVADPGERLAQGALRDPLAQE